MTLTLPRNSAAPVKTPLAAPIPRVSRTANANHLAHDARNWLTVLQVYCDLLRTSGAVANGYEQWIDELSGAVERGHVLVDSLLRFVAATDEAVLSRKHGEGREGREAEKGFSAGPMREAESLDLVSALDRRLPLLQRLAGNRIRVEISTPGGAGKVRLAESAFERILYNLAANAIEAMPRGGRLRIGLCVGPRCGAGPHFPSPQDGKPRRTLLLRVADTGSGIDPERLPYIFDAGVSGKRERGSHPERHGFGLAIVRDLTECAGGEIRVRSRPGRGSRFEVELPMV